MMIYFKEYAIDDDGHAVHANSMGVERLTSPCGRTEGHNESSLFCRLCGWLNGAVIESLDEPSRAFSVSGEWVVSDE